MYVHPLILIGVA